MISINQALKLAENNKVSLTKAELYGWCRKGNATKKNRQWAIDEQAFRAFIKEKETSLFSVVQAKPKIEPAPKQDEIAELKTAVITLAHALKAQQEEIAELRQAARTNQLPILESARQLPAPPPPAKPVKEITLPAGFSLSRRNGKKVDWKKLVSLRS